MLRKLTHIIIILALILFNVKCTNESLDLWNEPSNSTIVNTRTLNINSDEIGISNTSVEDTVTAYHETSNSFNDNYTDEIVDDSGLLYELLNKVNSNYYKPTTPFEYYYGMYGVDKIRPSVLSALRNINAKYSNLKISFVTH